MNIKSSYIYLRNLRIHAPIGVDAQEKVVGNDFLLNLRIRYDIQGAMTSDDVSHTLSYAQAFEAVKQAMCEPCNLIEHAAYRIATVLFEQFPGIEGLDIDVCKVCPPMGADSDGAGIELHLINDKTL